MMATEATSYTEYIASKTPEHDLTTSERINQDVSPTSPLINGANIEENASKQDPEFADAITLSAEVSISGGSDTETTKAETSKGQDGKGHVRAGSTVKKLTSFKPVSVNKTFLAARPGSISAPSVKLGEKQATTAAQVGTSGTAAVRPRLVAKTGSGIRDSNTRTAVNSSGGKGGAAPDASAVWNKNRPTPAPEPKRFTDEELKQRYGIHLATRLQSDDPSKQANWADIDDDDDDWAPETIEWTDGTKITLPQADDQPPPAPEPAAALSINNVIAKPPMSQVEQPTASPSLKPGGLSSGRTGLILKGAAEKPTLVAKPPGLPTPVKSPWATLPPVDKAAPVAIDIPQQQGRFPQRDPHGFQGMPPPPAKEIAADDFSRAWRDGNGNTSKELYNSQSGRYEPVTENRRGGRQDSRQPALLQRPQPDGPAEPSPAFQTHRASVPDSGYGRRRTSSNVSGGSGNFIRRMSRGQEMPPPHEMLGMRRGSLAAVSDAPSSPRNFSPSGQPQQHQYSGAHNHNQTQITRGQHNAWQARPSPPSTHGQAYPLGSGPIEVSGQTGASKEDIIEQQKLMQQKREAARKRKQEEEAKEEAAKQERIRIKLEAMGPPPRIKKNRKDMNDANKEEDSTPTQIQQREPANMAISDSKQSTVETELKVKSADVAAGKSEKSNSSAGNLANNSTQDSNRPNGHPPTLSTNPPTQPSQDNQSSKPWQHVSGSAANRSVWSSTPQHQPASRNVWGPPTNDRTLGNGTFDSGLSSKMPDVPQPNPGPIGPPNSTRTNNSYPRREPYASRPGPIGPPNKNSGVTSSQNSDDRLAAWRALPDQLERGEAVLNEQHKAEVARQRALLRSGQLDIPTAVKETWRPVSMNADGTRGKTHAAVTTFHGDKSAATAQSAHPPTHPPTEAPTDQQDVTRAHGRNELTPAHFNDTWKSASNANAPTTRSRFFPTRDVRLEDPHFGAGRPGSPSPPPPTMTGHPAYDGDVKHPQVHLPKPSPVVKLPPTVLAPIAPLKPANFAAALARPAPVHNTTHHGRQDHGSRPGQPSQDIRRSEAPGSKDGGWQNKIDTLIGRRVSPHMHSLTVDSSSKNALDLHRSHAGATVSLPTIAGSVTEVGDITPISKPPSEECFEEQEMGSLPNVRIANRSSIIAITPASPKSLPKRFNPDVTTAEPLFQQALNHNSIIIIKLPGHTNEKTVRYQARRRGSIPRRGNHRGSSRQTSSSFRGDRTRDAMVAVSSLSIENASASPGPTHSGRGRGRGGYGNHWNHRNTAPAVHTAS